MGLYPPDPYNTTPLLAECQDKQVAGPRHCSGPVFSYAVATLSPPCLSDKRLLLQTTTPPTEEPYSYDILAQRISPCHPTDTSAKKGLCPASWPKRWLACAITDGGAPAWMRKTC
ncbi:hypothetical protein MPNT_120055 [Candidatus Methylacidithermus pantelleriae]|uniref:Uncharacterized protein n=1 Tax=Candidatus Methylacidithermus pantelleriae TaxID=2744239 RepID=A0A8J2FVE3_9BACT|nr:hypothetical protein MPNT_120055 [Candidatus Methylacidithermus pantelleriae]